MMEPEESLSRFAALIERRLGLAPLSEHQRELAALLAEVAPRRHRKAYLDRLEAAGAGDAELRVLAERLMVGETYFFRHLAQLEVLAKQVLPDLQVGGRSARVLSVGCSSGEEAYSVAILGRESPWVDDSRLLITGVDVNPRAIERARCAQYAPWALRTTSEPLRGRWFQGLPGGVLELRREARDMVHFEVRNLFDDDPGFWAPGSFDVILCRNVIIYFSPEATRRAIARMARALTPGGFLFLGPSETLRGISDAFETVQAGDAFYYRLSNPLAALLPPHPPVVVPAPLALPPLPLAAQAPTPRPLEPASVAEGMPRLWQLLQEERYAEASAFLERLSEHEREQPVARLLRATLHLHTGDFREAERLSEALLESGGAAAAAYYLQGLCREQSGDPSTARARYERAIHLEPTFALGHLRLGMLARRAGALTPARVALRLSLTLLAHEQPVHLALFGGGFGRHGLMQVCQRELWACSEVA
jgi:chemotaxis protein methyltransferase CheR